MNKKCRQCRLINFASAEACARCNLDLSGEVCSTSPQVSVGKWLILRAGAVVFTCAVLIAGFYLTLLISAKRLTLDERETVKRAIAVLREKGFDSETMLLSNFTAFRGSDNWLNASVAKENAYAATNFPFEITTLYPDFFAYPSDDTERAAILLHEARHLMGEGEKEAYEFVWKSRERLGWTRNGYGASPVWLNVRHQTREHVPELFNCIENLFADCTGDRP